MRFLNTENGFYLLYGGCKLNRLGVLLYGIEYNKKIKFCLSFVCAPHQYNIITSN